MRTRGATSTVPRIVIYHHDTRATRRRSIAHRGEGVLRVSGFWEFLPAPSSSSFRCTRHVYDDIITVTTRLRVVFMVARCWMRRETRRRHLRGGPRTGGAVGSFGGGRRVGCDSADADAGDAADRRRRRRDDPSGEGARRVFRHVGRRRGRSRRMSRRLLLAARRGGRGPGGTAARHVRGLGVQAGRFAARAAAAAAALVVASVVTVAAYAYAAAVVVVVVAPAAVSAPLFCERAQEKKTNEKQVFQKRKKIFKKNTQFYDKKIEKIRYYAR